MRPFSLSGAIRLAFLTLLTLVGLVALGCTTAEQDSFVNGGATQEDFLSLEQRAISLAQQYSKDSDSYDQDTYYRVIESGLATLAGRSVESGRSGSADLAPLDFSTLDPIVPDDRTYDEETRQRLDQLMAEGRAGIRIIGGKAASTGEFTETVALVREDGFGGVCTGTVIAPGQVLTAAHCACEMELLKGQHGQAKIYFGNPTAVGTTNSAKNASVKSPALVMDEGFCRRYEAERICGGDLAILFYDAAATPDYVKPARLMTPEEGERYLTSNTPGSVIVGHGATRDPREKVPRIRRLRHGATEPKMYALMPNAFRCGDLTCSPDGTNTRGCLPDIELYLIDWSTGRDTCSGDSGGPVLMNNGEPQGPQVLVAVTSRSASTQTYCGAGGYYTSVFSKEAINWLDGVRNRAAQ